MRELEYPFDPNVLLRRKLKIKKQLLADQRTPFLEKKIAVLGGSTTKEVVHMMELFLLNMGIRPQFYESEYNRFYEDGMFGNPALEEFGPDIIYVHTSARNIMRWPAADDGKEEAARLREEVYGRFEGLWGHLEETYHCPIIQNNFELPYYRLLGNQDACYAQGKVNFVSRLNLLFYDYGERHENFFIHDINYEAARYGLKEWSDPLYWHMYKYAMCLPAIPYTAYNVALIIKSIFGKNKKVLALDLDNTLWGGVVGDDGADNIEIGQETPLGQMYGEFQSYVKEQKQIGVLLAVNSKNQEETARLGLRRPDSVLKEEDFAAFKANWNPKDRNLMEIAEELNLMPESMVFVDDNPAERELVRRSLPETAVPEMVRAEQYIEILDGSGFFEVTAFSEDDKRRNQMYQAEAERKKIQVQFEDYEEYLRSLEMAAAIRPFETQYLSRIAQLTNKSNQFNLTTRRYTQAEIETVSQDEGFLTLYGKLEDKFGDNGVVSVVIGRIREEELHLELWLMSCRVLKRGMESAMMDEVVFRAKSKGIHKIVGYYYPTAKNGMVKDFYESQGFQKISEDDEGRTIWELEISGRYEKKNTIIKRKDSMGDGTDDER